MGINAYVSGFLAKDYHTEAADTVIAESVDGQDGKRLALIGYDYLAAATAHTMSVMHCGSGAGTRNTASAAAAASQKDLVCTTAPLDPAGNAAAGSDIIAYKVTGGAWEWNTVASLASSTITLTNNIAVAVESGAAIRLFGVVGDGYSFKQGLTASETTHYDDTIIAVAPFKGDPLYVSIDNATHAGFMNQLLFAYINK